MNTNNEEYKTKVILRCKSPVTGIEYEYTREYLDGMCRLIVDALKAEAKRKKVQE